MINEPQFAVPYEHIGVESGAVHVCQEGVEPDNLGGCSRIDVIDRSIEGEGSGKEMQTDISADTPFKRILDLFASLR